MSAPARTLALLAAAVFAVASASGAGAAVGVWRTTADLSAALARQPDTAFGADTGPAPLTVTVDPTVRYQQMDGFGVSLTDSSSWLIMNQLTAAKRAEVMDALFGPDGIGLSLLRQPMGSCDFSRSLYSYDDTAGDTTLAQFSLSKDEESIIPALKLALAQNPGIRLIASPWSPPGWMKTSGSMIGGTLNADLYGVYADYFVKFIEAYADEGIGIYAVTPQNEPGYSPSNYPGSTLTTAQQIAFIDDLGPALKAADLSTKIICYDHNYDYWTVPQAILSDATAAPYTAGAGFHHYGGDPSAMTTLHALFPAKDIWFTEGGIGDWNNTFDNVAHEVVEIPRNWAKSIIFWNAALDQKDGPALIGDNNTNQGMVTIRSDTMDSVTYNPQYYYLGQLSKFVKPGAWRIDSTTWEGSVETVAFQNPDGSLALVVLNRQAATQSVKIDWAGQSLATQVPSTSLTTFVWTPAVTPVTITAQPAPATAAVGSAASFSVTASGDGPLTYQWQLNGTAIAGATAATYSINSAQAADAGSYSVVVANAAGAVTSSAAVLTVSGALSDIAPNRFLAISTRCFVGQGSAVGVAGFILNQPSVVLVRAGGPSLVNYGVSNTLQKPMLTLYDSNSQARLSDQGWKNPPTYLNGTTVASDGSYGTSYDVAQVAMSVGAYGFTTNDDSAMVVKLPAGLYTVQVQGADGGTGNALIEVFLYRTQGEAAAGNRFAAISTRCHVGRGNSVAVVGLAIQATSKVLIRAVGPTLGNLGVSNTLPKPQLVLYNASGQVIGSNTGWEDDAGLSDALGKAAAAVHDFALVSPDDSAVLVVLPAGLYTAQIEDRNGATGNAIVEAYLIP